MGLTAGPGKVDVLKIAILFASRAAAEPYVTLRDSLLRRFAIVVSYHCCLLFDRVAVVLQGEGTFCFFAFECV